MQFAVVVKYDVQCCCEQYAVLLLRFEKNEMG